MFCSLEIQFEIISYETIFEHILPVIEWIASP